MSNSTTPRSSPPVDSSTDLSLKAESGITESAVNVTSAVLESSPTSSSNEKSSTNSSSTPPPTSSSSSTSHQKAPLTSPPPQAFKSLPLSSGTICPPSFTTPIKPEKQFDTNTTAAKKDESTTTDSGESKENDKKDLAKNLEVSSPSLSKQSNVPSYGSVAKVKGIDEYLPKSNDEQVATIATKNSTNIYGNKKEEDQSNAQESSNARDNPVETPKSGNVTSTQGESDDKKNVEIRNIRSEFKRRSSETTITATNLTTTLSDDAGLSFDDEEKPTLNDDVGLSFDDHDGKPVFEDNDDSVTSSVSNSNSRSLLPRSLDLSTADESNGFRPSTLRGRGFVDIGSGGASILSSQESSSKESSSEIQNNVSRMRHLGMLLDRHHDQINTRRRNYIASEPWWQNEDDSSIEKDSTNSKEKNSIGSSQIGAHSAESSNLGPMSLNSSDRSNIYPSKAVLTTSHRPSSALPSSDVSVARFGKRNSLTSGDSIQDLKNRKNNDSLFENFDKTWQSFHEGIDSDSEQPLTFNTSFAREQICFASMVLVLLQQMPLNSEETTNWSKSIPIEIVKLFWENVIFVTNNDDFRGNFIKLPPDYDLKSTTEKITDSLLNKLRYVSIDTDAPAHQGEILQSIKLSHEVYADYSKHILKKYDLLPENCVCEWNASFVTFLKDLLDDHLGHNAQARTRHPKRILLYAATYIPKLILLSLHPEISHSDDIDSGLKDDSFLLHQKDRVNYLISLMKNSVFLKQRMKILGGILQQQHQGQDRRESSTTDGIKKRFQSESYLDRVDLDALKATAIHIEDLEAINIVLSMMPKEVIAIGESKVLDHTETILSLYKAWKELCITLLQEDLSNISYLDTDSTAIEDNVVNFDGSRGVSGPIIQSSERTQRSLPKCFRLNPGEYELQIVGPNASIKKNNLIGLSHKENIRRSRHQESKEKSCASMRLSHVLRINPAHLYRYVSIGKAVHLLGESIFKATFYTAENNPSSKGVKSLLGTSPSTCSMSFLVSSIAVYMQVTHLMSFILSTDIGDVDEDDLIDMGYRYDKDAKSMDPSLRMRKLLQDRTEVRVMFEKLNILCAESWLALGTYLLLGITEGHGDAIEIAGLEVINRLEKNDVEDIDPSYTPEKNETDQDQIIPHQTNQPKLPFQSKILLCFQMALGVLLHNTSCIHDQNSSFRTELTSVVVYARNLKASIIHSIGVHYYEQVSDYQRARIYLDSSLASRRLLLRLLQREDPDDLGILSAGSSMTKGYKRRYSSHSRRTNNRQKRKPRLQETQSVKKNRIDIILNFEMSRKKQITLIEQGLSTTLEFSALASHCLFDYDASLSSFQEALILRALHSGKDSLEVASLQYNMGVVHDDLAQYEASLGRYGESLRVRFSLLEKLREGIVFEHPYKSSVLEFLDLEASVILTLRCMANVYRALNDATNALGCIMKAIELLKDKLKRNITKTYKGPYQSADGDLGFGKGMMIGLPMPKIILDEVKGDDDVSKYQKCEDINKKVSHTNEDDDDAIRREISSMYKTIISLLQERAAQRSSLKVGVKSGYTSSASSYTSGSFSKSTRSYNPPKKDSQAKKGLDSSNDNDSIHLDSAFNLGILSLHFDDQKGALSYFEDALRTLWTTFSGDSSGESSDSDFSKSSSSRSAIKKRPKKIYFKGQVEEGALYHALAVAHASLSDHERAVRCYVTALRYYRRRFGLECNIVAGALYDCAFSYWKLGDNDRAEDFWADCLKILLCGGDEVEKMRSISDIHDLHVARTLYNLAAAKLCKGEYNDQYISTCLNDAKSIFQRLSGKDAQKFHVEIGHCAYYSGFLYYKKSVDINVTNKDSENCKDDNSENMKEEYTCKEEHLKYALSFIDESLHNYLAERGNLDIGLEKVEVGQKLQHPMQAHIAHLSAWIHDALGLTTQAQWNYKIAIRLLNKVYSPENLYSASAMHSLAHLYLLTGDSNEALHYYKEALVRRAQLLGSDHSAVADTLFQMAGIIGNSLHYTKASSMFAHCLRIRILTEGNDGENVAETLLSLALLHDKNGHCKKAQECLQGALKVRKSRLQAIIHSCIANVEHAVDSGSIVTEDCVQRTTRVEQMKLAYIMHNLGNVLLKLGDISEAMTFYNEALDIRRKLIGIDDRGFAIFVNRNDFESALELNRDILREMADTLHNLGGVYETKSMQQKALSCYNQALIIKRSTSKEKQVGFSLDDQIKSCNTLSSAFTLLRIGAIHNELHNHDVSLSYYKSAVNIQRQHLGRDHISVAQTLVDMGLILRRQMENYADPVIERTPLEQAANKYFTEALRISKLRHGSDHVSVAGIMYHIGSMYDQGGDYVQAMNHYQHSVKVYGREYAKTLCKSLFNIASVQRNQYDYIVDSDHGLFHPTTLRNNLLPVENNTSVVFSRGVMKNSTKVTDIDRDAYLRASMALAQVATRSGFIWIHGTSFQHFVLRFLHFISTNGVDPIRDALQTKISTLMDHFAKAGSHAVITVKDAPQSNYLYLINE